MTSFFHHDRPVRFSYDAFKRLDRSYQLRNDNMPLIQVSVIKGVFSPEQKSQMITRLTDALVSIEGENLRGVTWVKIDEIESGAWGIGGQALTTEAVLALAAGQTPVAAN
jgi:4-oxalocrotonate tautomerase